jgi:hypothetical protein
MILFPNTIRDVQRTAVVARRYELLGVRRLLLRGKSPDTGEDDHGRVKCAPKARIGHAMAYSDIAAAYSSASCIEA